MSQALFEVIIGIYGTKFDRLPTIWGAISFYNKGLLRQAYDWLYFAYDDHFKSNEQCNLNWADIEGKWV